MGMIICPVTPWIKEQKIDLTNTRRHMTAGMPILIISVAIPTTTGTTTNIRISTMLHWAALRVILAGVRIYMTVALTTPTTVALMTPSTVALIVPRVLAIG